MKATPIPELDKFASNVDVIKVENPSHFPTTGINMASRWRFTYENGCHLDGLLLNKGSQVLVVSLHGALNRSLYQIPRFERLASLAPFNVSSLYFSDPSLYLDENLQLAWFTGWQGSKLPETLAKLITDVAESVGAQYIIVSGSSGGGFASLQISSYIPDSIALAFNPQTHIAAYLEGGKPSGRASVRKYIEVVVPEAAPDGSHNIDWTIDWSSDLDDRYSAVRRYSEAVKNWVVYANNTKDFHISQHYEPFKEAMISGGSSDRLHNFTYDGKDGHNPPSPVEFNRGLRRAMQWGPLKDSPFTLNRQ